MPVSPEDEKRSYKYTTDFGTSLNCVLAHKTAVAGSFPAGEAGLPTLKLKGKYLTGRKIHGITSDGTQRDTIHAPTIDQAKAILDDGTFTIGPTVYQVTGYTGEKQTVSPPAGG